MAASAAALVAATSVGVAMPSPAACAMGDVCGFSHMDATAAEGGEGRAEEGGGDGLAACPLRVARGSVIGAALGGGYHLAAASTLQVVGRGGSVDWRVVGKQALSATWRLGAVFGLFAGVRCAATSVTDSPLSASLVAGAVAVGLPTAAMAERRTFLRAYYANVLGIGKDRVPTAVIVTSSMVSGALTFGVGDHLVRRLGVDW